ncbi:TylF/MycF/NovP-related O-methyltransferase [Lacrimispora algidixylanolytica]|uniref:PglD N-terminal domain-containing protein n=1 Tax=Lacrimispora algidixylanolytica TaxID=94868 RepID=A0A419TBK1_9FIRM|nr:TylF/MycF/NovP-related O-methyltransferase [Lacrimispora algidixylanolytica]RKD34827.1 hypothetical protein BET01_00225 [Lacrimispora algidixylanolytica]
MVNKEKVIIFGAGGTGKALYKHICEEGEVEIVAFADSFVKGRLEGLPILSPQEILLQEFDIIYIASVAMQPIVKSLLDLGIKRSKISKFFVETNVLARNNFLKCYAEEIYRKNINGNVAEAGVYRGEFAALMNKFFPDRKLYLFDTFEGFDERDIQYESGYSDNSTKGDYFKETSVELVKSEMINLNNVIIKKGYVPDTLFGVEDKFCFVNLDMDLYKPTLEALRFFYPQMIEGCGILVHDYFDIFSYRNLKQAVIEFVEETGAKTFPIGDEKSILVVK